MVSWIQENEIAAHRIKIIVIRETQLHVKVKEKALRHMVWVRNALFLYAQLCGFTPQALVITSV